MNIPTTRELSLLSIISQQVLFNCLYVKHGYSTSRTFEIGLSLYVGQASCISLRAVIRPVDPCLEVWKFDRATALCVSHK